MCTKREKKNYVALSLRSETKHSYMVSATMFAITVILLIRQSRKKMAVKTWSERADRDCELAHACMYVCINIQKYITQ